MSDWLVTIVSVIAGGSLTMFAGWLSDKRLTEREREHRREERSERLLIRRNEFQRDTLLALQVSSQKLVRNAGASLHQDFLMHDKTGKWQKEQLQNGLSDEFLHFITETMLLASRVLDEEVRTLADQLRKETAAVLQSYEKSEAQGRMMAAGNTQQALVEKIGQIVRRLDEENQ